jgi:hypothetical protein
MGCPTRAGLEKDPSDNLIGILEKPVHFAAKSNRQKVAAVGASRVVHALRNAFLAAQLGNARLAAQAFEHDADLLFS